MVVIVAIIYKTLLLRKTANEVSYVWLAVHPPCVKNVKCLTCPSIQNMEPIDRWYRLQPSSKTALLLRESVVIIVNCFYFLGTWLLRPCQAPSQGTSVVTFVMHIYHKWGWLCCFLVNPVDPLSRPQDLHTNSSDWSPYISFKNSGENLVKDQSILPLVINLVILITFYSWWTFDIVRRKLMLVNLGT